MKTLFVTGGAGFIGSNFVNNCWSKLNNDEVKIIVLDKVEYCSRIQNIDLKIREHKNFKFVKANLKNTEFILHLLIENNVNIIIHFAAQTHVDNSFGNSLIFTEDNVLGTHSLLEASKSYGKLEKFIHMSTDEVYGGVSLDHGPCYEDALLNPTNPYAATKAGAEFLVRSYGTSFQLPYIIVRANNIYGPRQYPEKIIPKFIMQLLQNKKLTIHGEGKSRRAFLYVNDLINALWIIIQNGVLHRIYNIGTNNEFSVIDIAKILISKLSPNTLNIDDLLQYVPDRNFNDFRYHVDWSQLTELGWNENVSFDDGISETINWYLNNQSIYI